MLGLDYSSSDEEDAAERPKEDTVKAALPPKQPTPPPTGARPVASHAEVDGAPQGPQMGPAQGPLVSSPPADEEQTEGVALGSPYASNRSKIRNLTLPTMPNFDIPASPPGSPPQRATKKFAQFLELKKKGQHFNQRLEGSSVMKDPGHLQRLLDFAAILKEGQYASTLPQELAVPTAWPEWAYVEQLNESRKRISKAMEVEKAQGKRDKVEFVKATGSGTSSGTGTPSGGGGRAGAQSAAERIMTELNSRKPDKTDSRDSSRKRELERRGRKGDNSSRSKYRSRSRSPRRRRSKSRERDHRRDRSRDRR